MERGNSNQARRNLTQAVVVEVDVVQLRQMAELCMQARELIIIEPQAPELRQAPDRCGETPESVLFQVGRAQVNQTGQRITNGR
jgi:hypothetical protein